jgi:PAS domain S-box-containing protein/putative nucleotidyltransferase with HDIG domain
MSSIPYHSVGVDVQMPGRDRPRRAFALDLATVALVVAILTVSFVARGEMSDAVDADELLPIVLLALRFGRRGGLAGAAAATALTAVWELGHGDGSVGLVGYAGRVAAFSVTGLLIGLFVEQRRRAEAKLVRYFDASLDLLATVEANGRLVRANPAWQATLGYTAEELLARPLIELVHPDERRQSRERFAKLAAGGADLVSFRNRARTADGQWRWLEWNAHASRREGLVHATARDVTAQVEAEDQLSNNAKLLEEMVAARTAELEEARAETMLRLARAGEYRDDETFHHTERVGATSAAIAKQLGLDPEQVKLIREAAPLHDIGKIAISDRILLKPGALTPEERTEMERHAEAGAQLLSGSRSPVLHMAAVIAASHHERWDGTGYPRGLVRERIPFAGRIVAVADVFDALTHDRPYKKAWPVEAAIAEIRRASGSQFDPRVVAAFMATQGYELSDLDAGGVDVSQAA